jgi:hypothetical protein
MVAISFNSGIGDSWEFADSPAYPERYSALGIRIGVDYVIYSMTHQTRMVRTVGVEPTWLLTAGT